MTSIRQNILRLFYPLLMKAAKRTGKHATILTNKNSQLFQTPIYDIPVVLNDGNETLLRNWQGKKLLIVNTASNCGYTAQYGELQQLQDRYPQTLQVLGFPSNDFKNQEPENNETIAEFCQQNFGVHFPLVHKSHVLKGTQQHLVYQWLTQPEKNGWNSNAPSWNFCKYLVNEKGLLTHYFDSAISPLGTEMITAVEA
jgi:glutathione peroxidase